MFTFERLGAVLTKALHIFCPLIHAAIFSAPDEVRPLKTALGFLGGVGLGQLYYHLFLEEIPFPCHIGVWLGLAISFLLGVGIAQSVQLRCVALLLLPAGCGKAGRGVLKAVILSYVISGPITNLGLNAREVVRVFACSNELLHNLSMTKYELMRRPLAEALRGLDQEIGSVKDTLRSVRDVFAPISFEMENSDEVEAIRRSLSSLQLNLSQIPPAIDDKYKLKGDETESEKYQKMFEKKMEYRCQNQLAKSTQLCNSLFSSALQRCTDALPEALRVVCGPLRAAYHCDLLWLLGARPCDSHGQLCSSLFSSALQRCTDALLEALRVVCWPLRAAYHCDLLCLLGARPCDSHGQIDPGLGEGYEYLKRSKDYLTGDFRDVRLQYKVAAVHELNDVQDAKETGLRVIHAFEEKHNIMRIIYVVLNVCLALLCLRIVSAAITYHEMYLTSIEYDNLYVTGYFKKIDQRRAERRKHSLLPLKKMERSRYIDIHSLKYISIERQKLVNRMLKVMLEMITATTFVMLDRLFYEALAVVRAHAERGAAEQGDHDLEINVEGSGMVASLLRRVLSGLATHARVTRSVSNRECLPRPHPLSPLYYFYIYGGYLWIVLLLYFSAYTHRLSRLICSYFYPRREKQRILHLYNDILKKRMKLDKTLRKTAVQAVRAYYLSGENLLSLRMRFPRLLGWLSVLPAARMKCLVCGETEPSEEPEEPWHACSVPKCPFVYCAECWRDAGAACLACDPRLAELSDVDSLSEDDVRIK